MFIIKLILFHIHIIIFQLLFFFCFFFNYYTNLLNKFVSDTSILKSTNYFKIMWYFCLSPINNYILWNIINYFFQGLSFKEDALFIQYAN